FLRRGQPVRMKPTADEAVAAAPSVQRVVLIPRLGIDIPMHARDVLFSDVMAKCLNLPSCWPDPMPPKPPRWPVGADRLPVERANEPTEAEDPLMLIYTSGTTGRPKGAVHTHCGFPIKTAQDMLHCFDVQPGETMYWVSDIGWMMGPWEIFGMTLLGGTFVIYDGALD